MLLSSISSTKKFFQKTIKNFKSFFSPGYQRLPKASPHTPHFSYSVAASSAMDMTSNTSYQEMEKLYTDFSDQWESENEKTRRRRIKKKATLPSKQESSEVYSGSYISLSNASHAQKKNKVEKKVEGDNNNNNHQNNKSNFSLQKGRKKESPPFMSIGMREHSHRYCMVEQKLRELEMLDMNNVEYVLDIEEVLHYYSRLTCPAYLEIVDKFFLEMYSELFGPSSVWHASPRSVNSRLKLRYQ